MAKDKICSDCKKPVKLWGNAHFKLCILCNRDRLDEKNAGKNPQKQLPRTPIKRTALKQKMPEATGEAVMFKKIWDESDEHFCDNCGDGLGIDMITWYFSHQKAKSTHNEDRLDPTNTKLNCEPCHTAYGARGKAAFEARGMKKKPGVLLQLPDGRMVKVLNEQPLLKEHNKVIMHLIDQEYNVIMEFGKPKILMRSLEQYNLENQQEINKLIGHID